MLTPLFHGQVSKATYGYILDRVRSRLAGWKSKQLSWLAGCLWKARNDWVFNHVLVDPADTINKAMLLWADICDANEDATNRTISTPLTTQEVSSWSKPSQGQFKINCDGKKTSLAVIIRVLPFPFLFLGPSK
ncbi:hypothetical protein CsSME_00035702 [Camellia sinensis var. sinensis]